MLLCCPSALISSAILVPGWNPHLSFFYRKNGFHTNSYISLNSFIPVICVVSDIVWQCSVCHMWRCVAPNIQIFVQTSTSGSRRFKSYAPCSPIGAMLFLVPQLVPCCFWFRSNNFSFIIQLTSNRLLLYNSNHIIWAESVPLRISSTAYTTIYTNLFKRDIGPG